MTGGIIFDAYAIAFGLTLGAIAALVYALRAKHHRPRPFDWMRDAPEYAESKDHHVKVVPVMAYLLLYADVYEGQEMPQDLPYPGVIFREPIENDEGEHYYKPIRGLRMWYLKEMP